MGAWSPPSIFTICCCMVTTAGTVSCCRATSYSSRPSATRCPSTVRRPAIYELKGEKTVAQAVEIAGGLQPDADETLGQLERILPSSLREMRNIDLTSPAGRATELADGDKLKIPAIRPTLENSVTLLGYVFRPGQFEYH